MYELKTVIRKLFIACFLCLFLISCKDAKTDAIISLLQKWDGKEILFPKSPIFTVNLWKSRIKRDKCLRYACQ